MFNRPLHNSIRMYCDHAILFVGWSVGGWLVRSFVRYACLPVIQIAIAQPQFEFSEPNLVWGQTMKKKRFRIDQCLLRGSLSPLRHFELAKVRPN